MIPSRMVRTRAKYKWLLSVSILTLIVLSIIAKAGLLQLHALSPLSPLANPNTSVDQARTLIEARIDSAGGREAYREFRIAVQRLNEKTQHSFAHAFGEALYKEKGDVGISVCDASFNFGCYHGFLGQAIVAEGASSLSRFDEACKTLHGLLAVECQHGIGHGIAVYTGSDILRSLALCKTLTWYPEGGCRNGVYMEFNFRNFASLSGEDVRPLASSQGPYYPCSIVPEEFTASCYSQQPYWWSQVLHTDYRRMGVLCADIAEAGAQEACFEGVGKSGAIFAKYSAPLTIRTCALMPSAEGEAWCEEGASRLFAREKKTGAASICRAISTSVQERCLEWLTRISASEIPKGTEDF